MKIVFVSTYPPSQCGIATFTSNLIRSLPFAINNAEISRFVRVIAVEPDSQEMDYCQEVKMTIRKEDQGDYVKAAKYVNYSDCDLCVIEHEFGIFGGESGIYVLSLLYRLQVPAIVTLHTVLKDPSFTQRSIMKEVAARAQKLVVMSHLAKDFLDSIYKVPIDKIALIEHGVPDGIDVVPGDIKQKFAQEQKGILFTFGLLSRDKGIETVINALPEVVKKHPNVLYIVLGNTHPNALKVSGESYRNYLNLLVRENNLEDHVILLKKFVTEEDLLKFLRAADIYITPYLNEAQITSGTLSYAVGAGSGIVSTPYWHAKELLADGRGRLFDFKDSRQLASILNEMLDNPAKLKAMKMKTFEYGKHLRWKIIGKQYIKLARNLMRTYDLSPVKVKPPLINLSIMPNLHLHHLKRLTDDTGIVQHAKYGIPNLKEGYCLDDNSRALLAALLAYQTTKDKLALDLLPVYFSYINYMQNENGTFRNFLSFTRQFLDEEGSEDAFGRTIWALGYLIRYAPKDAYLHLALEIFDKAVCNFDKIKSPRGIANTIIGLSHFLQRHQSDQEMIQVLEGLVKKLTDLYDKNRSGNWHWFEDTLTYDNGIIPLALFHGVEVTGNNKIKDVAEEATSFLSKNTMSNGWITPVGTNGWFPKDGTCARFAQQATDVMAMVLLYFQGYVVTRKKGYIKNMFQSFTWFLGENDLRIPLYDHETKGCCDGLETYGVNRNQGAESTLAYLISHMTILNAASIEYQFEKVKKVVPVKKEKPIKKKAMVKSVS